MKKIGRPPSVIIAPTRFVRPINGKVGIEGSKYRITLPRAGGKELAPYHYDFGNHPLCELIESFLLDDAENVTAGTINHRATCMRLLGEFMKLSGAKDLTPEIVRNFAGWLARAKRPDGKRRFSESWYPNVVHSSVQVYESGLCQGRSGWTQRNLDTIKESTKKLLKGSGRRAAQASIDKAISVETFMALAKAVMLTLEQCRQILRAYRSGERNSLYNLEKRGVRIIDPNPFCAFVLFTVLRTGARSSEINTLTPSDINPDEVHGNHHIYVHAPDKEDDYIPVDDPFLEILELCREWSLDARKLVGEKEAGKFEDALLVYPSTVCRSVAARLIPVTTYSLQRSHLRHFYRKWFEVKVTDEKGVERPLLHAEGDPSRPFYTNCRKLRNAFAARFIEREPNRVLAQKVLRHSSLDTTETYYLHRTALTHAKKVYTALRSEAQMLVAGLRSAIEVGVSEETLRRAEEAGAVTPLGLCGSTLDGDTCRMASDCLVCPHLIVLANRKARFEADKQAYLKKAEDLEAGGDVKGAENALTRAKLCQAHLIRIRDAEEGVER